MIAGSEQQHPPSPALPAKCGQPSGARSRDIVAWALLAADPAWNCLLPRTATLPLPADHSPDSEDRAEPDLTTQVHTAVPVYTAETEHSYRQVFWEFDQHPGDAYQVSVILQAAFFLSLNL